MMTMNHSFLRKLPLLSMISFSAYSQSDNRPNFILIMADDLGYGDLGCYGNSDIKTPHLDQLAREGLLLTNMHSNGSLSTPTRAALLTGRYQQRAGLEGVLLENIPEHNSCGLKSDQTTFANVLGENGYSTALIGKWHLGKNRTYNPLHRGFNTFVGFKAGNIDYRSHVNGSSDIDWWDGLELKNLTGYTTELITQKSIEFIRSNQNRPFCLYIAHACPHSPIQAPQDSTYWRPGQKKGRQIVPQDRPTKEAYRQMIENMDQGIGELLTTLRSLGLEKKTFLFFTSDNGPVARNGGSSGLMRDGKSSMFEGGHRVPGIAYMPGTIAPGSRSDETILSFDLFPTMLELAGIKKPLLKKLDGKSILPVLKGKHLDKRTLFWSLGGNKAVREGDWKLVIQRSKRGKKGVFANDTLLFDLSKDLSERNNLAHQNSKLTEQLIQKLSRWEKEVTCETPEQLVQFIPSLNQ